MNSESLWTKGGSTMTQKYLDVQGKADRKECFGAVLFSFVCLICGYIFVVIVALGLSIVGLGEVVASLGPMVLFIVLQIPLATLVIRRGRSLGFSAPFRGIIPGLLCSMSIVGALVFIYNLIFGYDAYASVGLALVFGAYILSLLCALILGALPSKD